jgi:undecaprenyl-diphosphatase
MTYVSALILGIVQGVAEFLPISSSGHLAIFQNFFGLVNAEEENLFFDVLLHLGTLVAVFVAYRHEIGTLIVEFLEMLHLKKPARGKRPDYPSRRMILMLIIATLPLLVVLPVKDRVEALYTNTFFIAGALLVTGLLLFTADRIGHGSKTERNISLADALVIGFGQAIAVVPGLSRSGTTISAGLTRGLDRSFAVRFSFLLSIPAVIGANLLSLVDAVKVGIDTTIIPIYVVGVLAAMVSGYLSIRFLKYIAERKSFGGFAYYCWGAGLVTLFLSLAAA